VQEARKGRARGAQGARKGGAQGALKGRARGAQGARKGVAQGALKGRARGAHGVCKGRALEKCSMGSAFRWERLLDSSSSLLSPPHVYKSYARSVSWKHLDPPFLPI
jgi:hypothetical protein